MGALRVSGSASCRCSKRYRYGGDWLGVSDPCSCLTGIRRSFRPGVCAVGDVANEHRPRNPAHECVACAGTSECARCPRERIGRAARVPLATTPRPKVRSIAILTREARFVGDCAGDAIGALSGAAHGPVGVRSGVTAHTRRSQVVAPQPLPSVERRMVCPMLYRNGDCIGPSHCSAECRDSGKLNRGTRAIRAMHRA